MTRKRRVQRVARAAVGVLAVGALVLLWPAQLGGGVAFLSTVGSSMRPAISQGDLALIREGAPYRVGEVVAYHNGDLGQIALHRIVEEHDGRFRLQGDANTWIDSYEPTEDEILGRLWVLVPRAGAWLDWLRRPRDAALVTAVASLLIGTGVRQTRRRMRRRRTGQPVPGRGLGSRAGAVLPGSAGRGQRASWQRVALAAAVVLGLGGGLLLLSAGRPPVRTESQPVGFTHSGEWGYAAPATGGDDLLAGEAMRDGAPVYLRLTDRLDARFTYTLAGEAVESVRGRQRLVAVLSDTRGWQRRIELRAGEEFEGPESEISGTLDLRELQALIGRFMEQTGITNTNYRLQLVAETEVEAVVAGQPVQDTFSPELAFGVDPFALQPEPGGDGDPLRPVAQGSVERARLVRNDLGVFGASVAVEGVRTAGAALAGAGALLLLVALTALWRAPAERPSERIARRYGGRMLDVARVAPRPDERLVRMTDVRDLVRVAANLEAPVLHLAEGSRHRYLVQEGDTTYVYEVDDGLGGETAAGLRPLPAPLPAATPAATWGTGPATAAHGGPSPALLEIDLDAPLPPEGLSAPRTGLQLPPAPVRRAR